MCDTHAYLDAEGGDEELILESLDIIRPENGNVYLRSIFGEEKRVSGRIREISLSKHRVVISA